MAAEWRTAIAYVTGIIGLSFLIGFIKAYRSIYVALLGLAFLVMTAFVLIADGGAPDWLKWLLLGISCLLLLSAVFFAVTEVRAKVRLIQEERQGREREMWEYLEQLKRRAAQKGLKADEDEGSVSDDAAQGPGQA